MDPGLQRTAEPVLGPRSRGPECAAQHPGHVAGFPPAI